MTAVVTAVTEDGTEAAAVDVADVDVVPAVDAEAERARGGGAVQISFFVLPWRAAGEKILWYLAVTKHDSAATRTHVGLTHTYIHFTFE